MEKYCALRREIVMLEEQILSEEISGSDYVSDVVRGSSKSPPYIQHNIVVTGYGSKTIPRLRQRKARLEAECRDIEECVERVDDSIMRQLLTRRFIENKTIKEAAALSGYCEKQASRKIKKFFEKMSADVC